MGDVIIWVLWIHTIVHFLAIADFCLDVKTERVDVWGPFILIVVGWEQPWPSPTDGTEPSELCIRSSDELLKQRDWPGLAFTSNVKMYVYKWKGCFDAFVDPIFFYFCRVSIVFFNSETVRREVKSGKWDFQDGRSGRNAIAFRNILWRKKARKAGGIEEFALFLPVPPCPGTALGESKQNSKFCFNHFFKKSPEMFYFRAKEF